MPRPDHSSSRPTNTDIGPAGRQPADEFQLGSGQLPKDLSEDIYGPDDDRDKSERR